MPRLLVATVNQRVLAVHRFHLLLAWLERSYIRIIFPEIGARRADIGQELAGIVSVQIAHSGRQHDDVTRGLVITQDEFAHGVSATNCLRENPLPPLFELNSIGDSLRLSIPEG